MSEEGDLHAALMARVRTLTGYTILWPRKGGAQPADEHIRVAHLPNDSEAEGVSGESYDRQGFLVLTLVSPLGRYEAPVRKAAGEIADHFPLGFRVSKNTTTATFTGASVRAGRQEGQRWETPIFIGYAT